MSEHEYDRSDDDAFHRPDRDFIEPLVDNLEAEVRLQLLKTGQLAIRRRLGLKIPGELYVRCRRKALIVVIRFLDTKEHHHDGVYYEIRKELICRLAKRSAKRAEERKKQNSYSCAKKKSVSLSDEIRLTQKNTYNTYNPQEELRLRGMGGWVKEFPITTLPPQTTVTERHEVRHEVTLIFPEIMWEAENQQRRNADKYPKRRQFGRRQRVRQ